MLNFSKRFIYALSNRIWQKITRTTPGSNNPEKKLVIDFAKLKKLPSNIKSESSYNANLSNGSLEMGLKRTNYIAWADISDQEYHDHVIDAKIRLDSLGGYAAAGLIFHIMDETSYYLALISSKGYFRIDAVKDSAPKTLIAWTEISDFDINKINVKIITYGINTIILINDKWHGEITNNSITCGTLGFVLASYPTDNEEKPENNDYTCKAWLDLISIDTRVKEIEENYVMWSNESKINADGRLRLAETFAVMGDAEKSLEQIFKAWKIRDVTISSSITTSYTEVRTRRELLLAARMSFSLGKYAEAEKYIDSIHDQWADSNEGKLAYTEKIKILNEMDKFAELIEFAVKNPFKINKDIDYYTIIARCHWELKDYKNSAEAWDNAFEINNENAVYVSNAANAYEFAGNKKEALNRFITAGKIFLKQGNNAELEVLMPKLLNLGSKNWEARTLSGKWAFSIEDYEKSDEEFTIANKLRSSQKNRPEPDPAAFYLWALGLYMKGKPRDAIRLLEKAVELAPDYGLFRFKLAEIKIQNGNLNFNYLEELNLAIHHIDDDQKLSMAEHAGKLLFSIGDKEGAAYFLKIAHGVDQDE